MMLTKIPTLFSKTIASIKSLLLTTLLLTLVWFNNLSSINVCLYTFSLTQPPHTQDHHNFFMFIIIIPPSLVCHSTYPYVSNPSSTLSHIYTISKSPTPQPFSQALLCTPLQPIHSFTLLLSTSIKQIRTPQLQQDPITHKSSWNSHLLQVATSPLHNHVTFIFYTNKHEHAVLVLVLKHLISFSIAPIASLVGTINKNPSRPIQLQNTSRDSQPLQHVVVILLPSIETTIKFFHHNNIY